jgi:PAS domain S-box-containing protein
MRILIAEDNDANRKLLREQLETEGHAVVEATDGVEALYLLESNTVDAIISDILMPNMDGYRLCSEVRKSEQFRNLPFIFYTQTYLSASDEEIALSLGGDRFLRKPANTAVILQALKEVLDRPVRQRPKPATIPEVEILRTYNERLVRKLEERNTELMETQARFRAVTDTATDAIFTASADGNIVYANKAAELTFSYSQKELLDQPLVILLLPLFRSRPSDSFQRFLQTCQVQVTGKIAELIGQRKDGTEFPMELSLATWGVASGIFHTVIIRDITERKRLEKQFIEAQKMEVIGQLAGGVAHDFNNILSVIMGCSELIILRIDPDSPLRKHVEEIQHASERAAGLTRQLLVFSRKQTVQPVVLDLNDVVKDLDKMLRRLIGENIEMTIAPGKQIGRVKADSGYIGQVLMNLVINARDAMPNGGKLTIDITNVAIDDNYASTHTGTVLGDYVMLAVSDTGTGMADKVKAHLFEAFFTTKPVGKGTGLGLATCQTIMQQSGGHISVYSELGKGTTFNIYFPRIEEPFNNAATAPIQMGQLPCGTETLLIVEDEPSVRQLARGVLETQGYEVLLASNGLDALQVAREHRGSPIRLVVTDVIMPVMGGKVMAEWLKTTYPDLNILFTSGYTDEALGQHGVLEPGVAFLPKPYTLATLTRTVREMLDNESTSLPPVAKNVESSASVTAIP